MRFNQGEFYDREDILKALGVSLKTLVFNIFVTIEKIWKLILE